MQFYLPTLHDRKRVFDLLGEYRFRKILNLPLDTPRSGSTDYITPFGCYRTNTETDKDNAAFMRVHEDKVFFGEGLPKTFEFDVRLFVDGITRNEVKGRKKTKYGDKCIVYEEDDMIGITAFQGEEYYVIRSKNETYNGKRNFAHGKRGVVKEYETEEYETEEYETEEYETESEHQIKTLKEENKKSKLEAYVSLIDTKFYLFFGEEGLEGYQEYYPDYEVKEGQTARAVFRGEDGVGICCMWVRNITFIPGIVHELLHITEFIDDHFGFHSEEFRAYLIKYLTQIFITKGALKQFSQTNLDNE